MSQRRLPEPGMRDEFRRELRARLMREAALTLVPGRRERGWRAWSTWLKPPLAAVLSAIVLVIGAGSMAAGSVPGDVTFTLKRAIEEVRVAFTFDEVERVRVLSEIADQRLSELERVAPRNDKAPTASEQYELAVTRFREAVDTLQQAAPEDKSDLAQNVADAARGKHEAVLETLIPRLPENAKDPVERAIEQERRDTPNTKDKKERGGQQQNTAPPITGTPRATERTTAPRSAPRPADGRP